MANKAQLNGFHLFFIWIGAAISVAEILAGGYLADLGIIKGLWAIILGHIVGTGLLVAAGLIGYREKLPAIMSTRISFGQEGSYLISVINILQLIGWTAIMLIVGGRAVNDITRLLWNIDNIYLMTLLIGAMVCLWVFWGVRGWRIIDTVASAFLLVLTIVMSWIIFRHPSQNIATVTPTGLFSIGFELSIIMPLSWFPLISDYTSLGRSGKGIVVGPFIGYFVGSSWMYAIGMMGAIFAGSPDPTKALLAVNLGITALLIIVLAQVTTTFMDVYSAGISLINIFPKVNDRMAAVAFTIAGTAIAMVFPIERYVDFLYILGSVFSPLIAILLMDYFLLHADQRSKRADVAATVSLAAGIAFYYWVKPLDLTVGPTMATIAFTASLHALLRGRQRRPSRFS